MPGQLDAFVSALNQADSLPFLFIGSGVSRRYLGHDNWLGLMNWAASLTDRPIQYYAGQVSGDLPRAASLIASAFYDVWWNSPDYKDSRQKWSEQCTHVASPLKIEVAQRLTKLSLPSDPGLKRELKMLGSCQVDGIITTNYDRLLEATFPKYAVFVGQEDLLLRRSYQLAEIYKIHGSVDVPDSLVLTGDDYEAFDANSSYLVAKLMSVFVEHPIIFLGYSLGDRNVRVVLTSLLKCLSPEKIEEFKSRFIWIDFDATATEPVVDDHMIDLGETRLLPVLRIRAASFVPIFEVLSSLERVLPVGLLRRVEETVVKIVHSADPTRQIHVADLGVLDSLEDDDIVIGVGKQIASADGPKGLLGYNRYDLIVDTIDDKGEFDPVGIVQTTLPEILHRAPNAWLPVHKYIHLSGLDPDALPNSLKDAMAKRPKGSYTVPDGAQELDLTQLVEIYGLAKTLDLVCSFDSRDISADELQQLLLAHIDELRGGDANLGTAFGKATFLFGLLKYGSKNPDQEQSSRTSITLPPSSREIREWAHSQGLAVAAKGRIADSIVDAYQDAHTVGE